MVINLSEADLKTILLSLRLPNKEQELILQYQMLNDRWHLTTTLLLTGLLNGMIQYNELKNNYEITSPTLKKLLQKTIYFGRGEYFSKTKIETQAILGGSLDKDVLDLFSEIPDKTETQNLKIKMLRSKLLNEQNGKKEKNEHV